MGYRDGSPQLGAPGPGSVHQDKMVMKRMTRDQPLQVGEVSLMIVLFIVLDRNKLRIPLEGTYSGEM
jgi:hypothetical protein